METVMLICSLLLTTTRRLQIAWKLLVKLWDMSSGSKGVDIDASCVKFNREGEFLGAIDFADNAEYGNGICHSYDQATDKLTTSVHDDKAIIFKLSATKSEIHFLFFVATIFPSGAHSFQDLDQWSACEKGEQREQVQVREALRFLQSRARRTWPSLHGSCGVIPSLKKVLHLLQRR